jgi:hypothetical protein
MVVALPAQWLSHCRPNGCRTAGPMVVPTVGAAVSSPPTSSRAATPSAHERKLYRRRRFEVAAVGIPPLQLQSKVRRTFADIAFCARLSPPLSPCNHRFRYDENRVENQGDASRGQSYNAEPAHHAEDIEWSSNIHAEHNARRRRTLVHRAAANRGYRANDEHANDGKHSPRDEDAVDDRVSPPVIHA